MNWLIENKEWIFSGIGIVLASFILKLFVGSKAKIDQNQTSGNNSTNIQVGNDINIGSDHD